MLHKIRKAMEARKVAKQIGHDNIPAVVYPQKGEPDQDVLKLINILVFNAKAFILDTYRGVMQKHLQKYLNEFCYRFNRRFWPGQGFDRLLRACPCAAPVTRAEL